MSLQILPVWFWIIGLIIAIVFAFSKRLQEKNFCVFSRSFFGAFLEGIIGIVFIFLLQLFITQAFNSKLVLDIDANPDTRFLSITNNGTVPVENIKIYSAVYVVVSSDNFTATSTKVYFNTDPWMSADKLGIGQNVQWNLDDGTFFIFYNSDGTLTQASKTLMSGKYFPIFFTPFGTTTPATQFNIYYFFRISFQNSLTKERFVRYELLTAQKNSDWFNNVPGQNTSGSYPTLQSLLQIKELIFNQQQLEWGDTSNNFYNSF